MADVVLSEWMKIMLEEIERKRLEEAQAREEALARNAPAAPLQQPGRASRPS